MIFWCHQNARTQIAIVENHQDGIMAKVNSKDFALVNVETNGSEKCPPKTYIENKSMMLAKGNMVNYRVTEDDAASRLFCEAEHVALDVL